MKSSNNSSYTALLNDPKVQDFSELGIKSGYDDRGFWRPDVSTITGEPEVGRVFKFNGTLYRVASGVAEETSGNNYQYFTVRDLDTGTIKKIRADGTGNATGLRFV